MENIKYNMTLQYRDHWEEWEAIRELVQNALDEVGTDDIEIKEDGDDLVIKDNGEGLKERHLLLGVSEKESEDARGRFGEGLKMALIVLTRLGHNVEIKSGHLSIETDTYERAGEQCLKLDYEVHENKFGYTKVIIKDYDGPSYRNRFRGIGRTKISLASNRYGEVIRHKGQSRLYVKDIYIKDLENAAFSYNLEKIQLEESRNTVDEWDIRWQLKKLWGKVDNEDLWTELFEAIDEGQWESAVTFNSSYIKEDAKDAVRTGFSNVFGEQALIRTNEDSSREAQWRGGEIIDNSSFAKLGDVLETDQDYVRERKDEEQELIDDSELSEKKKEVLETIREIASENSSRVSVYAYSFSDPNTTAQLNGTEIRIARTRLDRMKRALGDLIHELAHLNYGTDDLTSEHIHAIEMTGAKMIQRYLD